jgi:hypothetical protein
MKRIFTLLAALCTAVSLQAQSDSTHATTADTIRIGNMIIVKKHGKNNEGSREYDVEKRPRKHLSRVSTNWLILDLGFNNYIDKTNYANPGTLLYNRPGTAPLGAGDFNLRNGKSINVNIWLFMQKLNLIKHHVSLKYGLGIELNNYRYNTNISFRESNPFLPNAPTAPVVFKDSVSFSKNKLAADYVTIPLMLNYSSHPGYNNRGFTLSAGISAGYLYSGRNKQISSERGKRTVTGNYGINQFKLSYIAEVGVGPVRLYGAYSPESMFDKDLVLRPYTFGIRFSNW